MRIGNEPAGCAFIQSLSSEIVMPSAFSVGACVTRASLITPRSWRPNVRALKLYSAGRPSTVNSPCRDG
ncbi:hypothetical protein SDC9_114966 [bioreactor metagenome]|uniref:Uncharacterized protein n=1 Tax=bioreactor metagenome TaxID=1076179 RepID=A0A645BRI2_9ZZZZ